MREMMGVKDGDVRLEKLQAGIEADGWKVVLGFCKGEGGREKGRRRRARKVRRKEEDREKEEERGSRPLTSERNQIQTMEVFPKIWRDLWDQWDIRVTVLVSLLLQVLLIMFASMRKRKSSKSFALFIWSIYLLADWVAAFALGLLCNSQGKSHSDNKDQMPGTSKIGTTPATRSNNTQYDDKLLAFWAPFLLLHLGGPDTITAFAMEDNELWPRHLLGLLFELGAAIYVLLLSIPENTLLVPTLFMFFAGTIKYGERTYALYRASLDGFRDSMLKEPDPGPNYAKLMEEFEYKKKCGLPTKIVISEEPKDLDDEESKTKHGTTTKNDQKVRDAQNLQEAHKFFDKFKGLIVELIFSFHERDESRNAFLEKSPDDAFKVVEFELSFVYEVLFTKAVVVHDMRGYILRAICSCLIIAAFLTFFFLEKDRFSEVDISITYTLLGGAIILDAFAFIMVIFSDWTVVRLENYRCGKTISDFIVKISPCERWSEMVTQHSLIKRCIPGDPSYFKRFMDWPICYQKVVEILWIQKISSKIGIGTQLIDEIQYTHRKKVTDELKKCIYDQLVKKAESISDPKETRRVCSCRGNWALEERGYLKEFGPSVMVEFDESLLKWHIATDLCYYSSENAGKEVEDDRNENVANVALPDKAEEDREICKRLSDYLAYLLVMRPFMMSSSAVIGKIRYRDTCAEATNFFNRRLLELMPSTSKGNQNEESNNDQGKREKSNAMLTAACNTLLLVNTKDAKPADVKGDRSKSVLFDACILAKELKKLEVTKRWKIMSEVLVEMLAYAAIRCPGIAHAQRLSKGGELLTFVWFLMTHLGLGEQYLIEAGHARAKLISHK
ncbi:hypothetical protein CKAN_01359600 [Cinnamomum micranthum f. kanehirae]|uniref:DUF4220 domain-containing protein n=1 Tax=Cinnamomum micranthum f. kanehirae TaxID=337451 RepID=A0A443P1T1_9MAGN|nr:hypothetical protein CKAN_01359600 [Cinnamomum micranthum f. kanehirae]